MLDWSRFEIRTNVETGEHTVSYSHTPEAFVDELKQCEGCIYVTKGSCCECHYTPDRFIPREAIHRMTHQALLYHRIPECICTAIARFQIERGRREPGVPNFVVCYGFYSQYVHRNRFLLAAKEAGLITFYDVADLPGFRETGLATWPDYFHY